MTVYQTSIFEPLPNHSRYLTFELSKGSDRSTIKTLLSSLTINDMVVGLGPELMGSLDLEIPGMKEMPEFICRDETLPRQTNNLWIWLKGDNPGDLLHRSQQIVDSLSNCFALTSCNDGFFYSDGRDLTGYVDGTENPQGEDALSVSLIENPNSAINQSSFVSVQQWQHNFSRFNQLTVEQQDDLIGRHKSSNEEFESAPNSAHVKRTAQESFTPEAFLLRRSMPWINSMDSGLMFVAFANSFYPFESILNRMTGSEDGIVDGLFEISRPINGAYYWCPALNKNRLCLDL
jgi:putative iron-dependent peroxidase